MYTFYVNDDPRLTLTYFTARSNFVTGVFEWRKLLQSYLTRKTDQIDRSSGAINMYMTIIFNHPCPIKANLNVEHPLVMGTKVYMNDTCLLT